MYKKLVTHTKSFFSNKRYQKALLIFCFLLAFFIRVIPLLGNHFYFTIDQGRDAVEVRDILHGHLTLLGPQTSVEHIYHGALWYYLLVLPYILFNGSPLGSVVFMIGISLATLYLAYRIGKNWQSGLAVLILLSIFMPFYETSRYAFNPFLLPLITLLFIFNVSRVNKTSPMAYYLASLAIGLSFHADIMVFVPFVVTFVFINIHFLFTRKVKLEDFFIGWFIVLAFLIPHLISELTTGLGQWHALVQYLTSEKGAFQISHLEQFKHVSTVFINLIGEVVLPQFPIIGSIIFTSTLLFFTPKKRETKSFTFFSLLLVAVSFAWFSSNNAMRPWHLVFIGPLLLISFVITISTLPKKLNVIVLSLLFVVQASFSAIRIFSYTENTSDAGLLTNQIETVDWIYQQAEGKGFSVYTYVPSVRDYHYQYLIYWRGTKKFGYVPCEYTTTPGISASSYIPQNALYQIPKKTCTNQFFLILEPAVTQGLQDIWHEEVIKDTQLIDTTTIGKIQIEKREKK